MSRVQYASGWPSNIGQAVPHAMSERGQVELEPPGALSPEERLRFIMSWGVVALVTLFAVGVFGLVLWRGLAAKVWLEVTSA
jgi:hypothetical protein